MDDDKYESDNESKFALIFSQTCTCGTCREMQGLAVRQPMAELSPTRPFPIDTERYSLCNDITVSLYFGTILSSFTYHPYHHIHTYMCMHVCMYVCMYVYGIM